MSGILAVLCAYSLYSAAPLQSHGTEPFTIHVSIEFDPSIKSNILKAVVKEEATAIWKAYDVELLWTSGGCDAALDLDVVVAAGERSAVPGDPPSAAGLTTIGKSGVVEGPIRISFDPIDGLLKHRFETAALLHDRELGRALGRVLAHELGHALLGYPLYHDRLGLMRPQLTFRDLTEPARDRFQLTDGSAIRLRDRLAHLAETQQQHRKALTSS